MIRSRLRRPTSKSITTVFLPAMARPLEMAALVVVLPTPPLPEVTTRTLDTDCLPNRERLLTLFCPVGRDRQVGRTVPQRGALSQRPRNSSLCTVCAALSRTD